MLGNDTNSEKLTHEKLLAVLDYNKDTGVFTHKITRAGKAKKGVVAGGLHPFGYWKIRVFGKHYFAHRLAWFYVYGSVPNFPIDHINGDSTDNRISNLREDISGFNSHNRHRANKKNSTGLLGVSKHGNKFQASIRLKWKKYHIGTFNTAEEAHFAYLKAKKELHPFANINGEPSSPM